MAGPTDPRDSTRPIGGDGVNELAETLRNMKEAFVKLEEKYEEQQKIIDANLGRTTGFIHFAGFGFTQAGSAPEIPGFVFCNGQEISREDYKDLYEVIGVYHGVGDGSTTFNVPDMRDMFLAGLNMGRTANYMPNGKPFDVVEQAIQDHFHVFRYKAKASKNTSWPKPPSWGDEAGIGQDRNANSDVLQRSTSPMEPDWTGTPVEMISERTHPKHVVGLFYIKT